MLSCMVFGGSEPPPPDEGDDFCLDRTALHRAEVTAVLGLCAAVAQNEDAVLRHSVGVAEQRFGVGGVEDAAALCRALRDLGKTAYLLPNPGITETYACYAAPYWAEEGFEPDFVVSVDIAALGLLPENAKKYASRIDLAIDHHPSNEGFAKESCVLAEMAACGEIIYEIAGFMTPMTAEID